MRKGKVYSYDTVELSNLSKKNRPTYYRYPATKKGIEKLAKFRINSVFHDKSLKFNPTKSSVEVSLISMEP